MAGFLDFSCRKEKERKERKDFLFSFLTVAILEACHVVGLGILFFFALPR